ncbi:hypothetical protein DERP_008747 [Dermatophagoides pteronyssinus]|uniref:Protein kinase domain-containing protein n=1 Tax=Dermatophagoides pteronyssinus TaxID=6956 RepID=A0ABQ8IWH6_DERPT|nr:hypothetical protein DERP_008747 [Dermatophagoides pteronyssinus]
MTVKHCLSGYEIHMKKLGEGGFGVVRLGIHQLTGQKVAIKIVDKRKLTKDLHRIKNEVSAMKNLCHPNIVQLLQYEENDQYIYLIMEYCSGGELFDHLLSKHRLHESECKRIFISLINILNYIHSKGIAHRDIKPENILFDDHMNIKLIDFGLCACRDTNPFGSLDCLATACGSPAYVAPELLKGTSYSGPPVDVWSTGVLLYVLFTGQLPFDSENLAKLYNTIKEGNYSIPAHLNSDVKDLLKRMLCVDPKKRITVDEIMKHKWLANDKLARKFFNLHHSNQIDQNDEFIDEKILLKCSVKFPSLDINNLRKMINENLDYHRSTYLLIRQKPELYPDFDRSLFEKSNRRRSRSFNNIDNQYHQMLPELKKIANAVTAATAAAVDDNNRSERPISTPKKTINSSKKPQQQPQPVPATENVQRFGGLRTTATPTATVRRTPVNRNLFNQDGGLVIKKPSAKPFDLKESSIRNTVTPVKIIKISTAEKQKSKNDDNNNNKENTTPQKTTAIAATPKKTLIKWLKEIASPRPTNLPKRISSANVRSLKNIFITGFFDPDKCRNRMLQLFNDRQINCQEKNYTIRCVMSARNIILVACELEIFICFDDNQRIVIQHKRIRGASWDYFKLMTDLQLQLNQ